MASRKDTRPLIFILEDEEKMLEIIRINLSKRYKIACFCNAEDALQAFRREKPELIVTDVRLPGMDGITFMERVKTRSTHIPFIVFTGYGSIGHAVETMKKGAFDYLVKPIKIENLAQAIDRAISFTAVSKTALKAEKKILVTVTGVDQEFITCDPATERMLALSQKAARFDLPILITGETGTGKDLIANYVHRKSGRKGPFVQLNCASIPRDILEGELFGYKKGAFTGAVQDYPGKISLSDGGTLFLDEIGELPLTVQAKLLNVIEVPEYYPIGSNVKKRIDLHLITATNRNLRKMVDNGEFRHDLYYRIAVIPITIPPLRERKSDILPIVDYLLRQRGSNCILSSGSKLKLLEGSWPGNVRELKNVIERSLLLAGNGNVLDTLIFDNEERSGAARREGIAGRGETPEVPDTWDEYRAYKSTIVKERKEELDKLFIEKLLLKHRGNISVSARSAGIDRRRFQEMIRALDIDVSPYRKKR